MTPKFRGDEEDWLDSEDTGSRGASSRPKKKPTSPNAVYAAMEDTNGVVAEVYPKQCRVWMDDGRNLLCSYRRAGVLNLGKGDLRERSPVAVGDRVVVEGVGPSDGVVNGRADRANQLARPAPDHADTLVHVIAANVDQLCIVASAMTPEFSPGLVDRFLIAAQHQRIEPVIVINKIDLFESKQRPWAMYSDLGFQLFEVSAHAEIGIDALISKLQGERVIFCGHSGVGKTSLLRKLIGTDIGKVGGVSEATGKGKHTTTGAVLLGGPGKSQWIDTPGIREFGLSGVEAAQLKDYFPEMKNLKCMVTGCLHEDEEGCAAHELVRYDSYRRILDSLREAE